jgi:F-type H+-transporting ATPase subunit alpha
MTDGQIYTSAQLFGEGFKPAIDMGLSVSRIGSKVQWKAMKKLSGMLKLEYVRYKELERLTRIKAGVSGEVDRRLKRGKVLEEVLKQDANVPVAMEDEVLALHALEQGLLDGVEPADVRPMLRQFVSQAHSRQPSVIQTLVARKEITEDIKEVLRNELARFSYSPV